MASWEKVIKVRRGERGFAHLVKVGKKTALVRTGRAGGTGESEWRQDFLGTGFCGDFE
jgi:hypothetical protein